MTQHPQTTHTNEETYLRMLAKVLQTGTERDDRTGVGTYSLFGEQMKFDLREGFPLLTTKYVSFKNVAHELLWFISGSTNVRDLQKHGVTIWDEWAWKNGDLGPTYGAQWRAFGADTHRVSVIDHATCHHPGVNQLEKLQLSLKKNPYSRRHILTAWNPCDVEEQALPPCHILAQFYVGTDNSLSCHVYQRSADIFLGVPYNIASYALLTHMFASVCGYTPAKLIFSYGDVHLYKNHVDQAAVQLTREPRAAPKLYVWGTKGRDILYGPKGSLFDITYDDFELCDYDPHPAIKAEVAV